MAYARNGAVRLYYESFGDPADPALLLINGLGSQCINFRTEWCEMFAAEGLLTIRFDNRDVGLSTHFDHVPPDVLGVYAAVGEGREPDVPYRLSEMAADAVAVLDALAVERAHVLGLSMGGMIAQTIAIEHPQRLLSMTSMMSTTGDADVGHSSPEAQAVLFAPPPTDRESSIQRQLDSIRAYGSPACFDEARIRAHQGEAFDRGFDPAGQARQLMGVVASGSRSAALRDVGVPTLVLHGDHDRLVDPSGGRRTAEVIPGARFELIEGLGHDYPPEHWRRIVDLVVAHARAATASA